MSKASLCNIWQRTALAASLAMLLAACGSGTPVQDEPGAPIALVAEAAPAIDPARRAIGLVLGRQSHQVTSEAAGRIDDLHADVGTRVRRGELLASIEREPLRLQSAAAEAEVARAAEVAAERARALDRTQGLVEIGVASQAELDALNAEVETARRALDAARATAAISQRALRDAAVRAPIDGVIAARPIARSQSIVAGEVLFEIEGDGARDIAVTVPVAVASTLAPGAITHFSFDGNAGEARVRGISARATASGAREARLSIISGAPSVGTPVEVVFTPAGSNGSAIVPVGAVLTGRDGRQRVLRVDAEGRVSEAMVELVALTNAGALVAGAMAPGDRVVAAGGDFVRVGSRVRPITVQR
jgi:RND family efflux transporter MFP subunit